MILQEQGDQLIVIRQTDHAILSGFFSQECGNEDFERPEPFESFCLAASEHDNGWREWELAPEIDARTHLPYSFMSIPTEEHVALYQRGIERVVRADGYAGLLVSMHCSSLYDRARATLPGFSAKYVKSSETQTVNDFLQRLRLQQLRLKADLRTNASTKNLVEEKPLERNAQVLQALDRLSLYFCLGALGDTTIESVPTNLEGAEVDWELRWDGHSALLSPYPFRRSPLAASILARRVPKRVYGDAADFRRTLERSGYFALNFVVRARDAMDQRRSAVA